MGNKPETVRKDEPMTGLQLTEIIKIVIDSVPKDLSKKEAEQIIVSKKIVSEIGKTIELSVARTKAISPLFTRLTLEPLILKKSLNDRVFKDADKIFTDGINEDLLLDKTSVHGSIPSQDIFVHIDAINPGVPLFEALIECGVVRTTCFTDEQIILFAETYRRKILEYGSSVRICFLNHAPVQLSPFRLVFFDVSKHCKTRLSYFSLEDQAFWSHVVETTYGVWAMARII